MTKETATGDGDEQRAQVMLVSIADYDAMRAGRAERLKAPRPGSR